MGQGKWKIESGKWKMKNQLKMESGESSYLIFHFPLSISDHSSSNVCEPISVPPAKMSTR